MQKTRILLVDDHEAIIGGIRCTLGEYPELEVVGSVDNGREAVRKVRALKPDIVILDISMPDLNGIDAALQIRRMDQHTRIIIYTMHSDRQYMVDLLAAGVSAFVLKEDPMSDLLQAIRTVRDGGNYFSTTTRQVLATYLKVTDSGDEYSDPSSNLSLREREVLQLIAEGNTIKEIAGKLGVTNKTVETHRHNVMMKLDARSTTDLVRAAIKMKIIQL